MLLLLLLVLLLLFLLQGDPEVQSAKALRAAFEANDVTGVEKVRLLALTLKPKRKEFAFLAGALLFSPCSRCHIRQWRVGVKG